MDATKIREAKAKVEKALAEIDRGLKVKDEATRGALLEAQLRNLAISELVLNIDARVKELREGATNNLSDISKRLATLEGGGHTNLPSRLAALEVRTGALAMTMTRGLSGEHVSGLEKMIRTVDALEARVKQLEGK